MTVSVRGLMVRLIVQIRMNVLNVDQIKIAVLESIATVNLFVKPNVVTEFLTHRSHVMMEILLVQTVALLVR